MRLRRATKLLLLVLLIALVLPAHAGAAEPCSLPAALADAGEGPAWNELEGCVWPDDPVHGEFRPTTAAADGQNVYLLQLSTGRTVKIGRAAGSGGFGVGGGSGIALSIEELPALPIDPDEVFRLGFLGPAVLMVGPRALFAVVNTHWSWIEADAKGSLSDDEPCKATICPVLFRMDNSPGTQNEWRAVRPIAPAGSRIVGAALTNNTIWSLRALGGKLTVGYQPLGTASEVRLPPAGPQTDPKLTGDTAFAFAATRDFLLAFDAGRVASLPLLKNTPREPKAAASLRFTKGQPKAVVHAGYLYLIGGNLAADPVIERARITSAGELASWERFLDPSGQGDPGLSVAPIATATSARGFIWIFRNDGAIQVMRVSDAAAGQARIAWTVDQRPRVVELGKSYEIDVEWDYIGPMELNNLTGTVAATPAQTAAVLGAGATRPAPFAWLLGGGGSLVEQIEIAGLLPSPTAPGPTLRLCVKIPATTRRTEFQATILVRSNKQAIGPALRLQFKVATKKRPATETPVPVCA